MQTNNLLLIVFLFLIIFSSCDIKTKTTLENNSFTAKIIKSGYFEAFPDGLKNEEGQTICCESSAVVFDGEKYIIGNDKNLPKEYSAVFSLRLDKNFDRLDSIKYHTEKPFLEAVKYEDFAISPDKNYIFAITAFNRYDKNSSKNDVYNTLLVWPKGKESEVQVVSPITRDGIISSLPIREKIEQVLKMPYFKVEGLAVLKDKILFGVREVGESYKNFEYVAKIISVSYQIENGKVNLADDFILTYEFNPSGRQGLRPKLSLSGLVYDTINNRFFILTSFEENKTPEGIGAYIWVLPYQDYLTKKDPFLVRNSMGKPLDFAHKAEGITMLKSNTVFIICDDDRILGKKTRDETKNQGVEIYQKPNECPYYIVVFEQ